MYETARCLAHAQEYALDTCKKYRSADKQTLFQMKGDKSKCDIDLSTSIYLTHIQPPSFERG